MTKYRATDYIEDGIFRNLTPEEVVKRILKGADLNNLKTNIINWIERERQFNNVDDANFGEQVLNILINTNII